MDHARQHHGCEDIFYAVRFGQGHNNHGYRAGGTGNHPRATAKNGGDQTNGKGGIEARNQRKGHRFGYQGQGHGEPRQDFCFVVYFLLEIEKVQEFFHETLVVPSCFIAG